MHAVRAMSNRPPDYSLLARWSLCLAGIAGICYLASLQPVESSAAVIKLKNGTTLEGRAGKLSSVLQNPFEKQTNGTNSNLRLIGFVTDDLRRTYFSSYQVADLAETPPHTLERFQIPQRVAKSGKTIGSVGSILGVTPFDEFGRRVFSITVKGRGRVDVIQGITEITPQWTKVEGLLATRSIGWDMRLATSSIPKGILSAILLRHLDSDNANDRLRLVRFYTHAERYADARSELESIIQEFPELNQLKNQERALRQLSANQTIREIQRRKQAGQYGLAWHLLSNFPDEQVAQETLLKVQQLLDEYNDQKSRADQILQLFAQQTTQVEDEAIQKSLVPLQKEIESGLNMNTLPRLRSYLRLADDTELAAEQKLALGISAWVLGSGSNEQNLTVAMSLYHVRNLVLKYLQATLAAERQKILQEIQSLEGGTPAYVAQIIAHITPPLDSDNKNTNIKIPGLINRSVPVVTGHSDTSYWVQLPPAYDPTRRYPAIVTLQSANTTPEHQIDWWAGSYDEQTGRRRGQASRHGYIVIAPQWTKEFQSTYEYSAREHAAVLFTLRDACKRFSVDTDRVFLSGHSMGGDAAWDIALAHPDLWAGVIPIVATSDKYISRYWQNGRQLPMFFVTGELDGNKLSRNVRDFDRYLTKSDFDVVISQFLGRGHEHFQDEILRLFDWMSRHQRDFSPATFEFHAMRTWDNFGWWVEIDQIPKRSLVQPVDWPPKNGVRPVITSGTQSSKNHLRVKTGAGQITVWLSPDTVDFSQPISIAINGRTHANPKSAKPSLEILLEDVRTRGDRQHPFWAKCKFPTGRGKR